MRICNRKGPKAPRKFVNKTLNLDQRQKSDPRSVVQVNISQRMWRRACVGARRIHLRLLWNYGAARCRGLFGRLLNESLESSVVMFCESCRKLTMRLIRQHAQATRERKTIVSEWLTPTQSTGGWITFSSTQSAFLRILPVNLEKKKRRKRREWWRVDGEPIWKWTFGNYRSIVRSLARSGSNHASSGVRWNVGTFFHALNNCRLSARSTCVLEKWFFFLFRCDGKGNSEQPTWPSPINYLPVRSPSLQEPFWRS